jgi:hypothetical protein
MHILMKPFWARVLPMVPVAAIAGVAAHDLSQKKHALLAQANQDPFQR